LYLNFNNSLPFQGNIINLISGTNISGNFNKVIVTSSSNKCITVNSLKTTTSFQILISGIQDCNTNILGIIVGASVGGAALLLVTGLIIIVIMYFITKQSRKRLHDLNKQKIQSLYSNGI